MIELKDDLVTINFTHASKTLSGTMSFETFYATLSQMFDEQALAEAKAKVAEIEKRLKIVHKPIGDLKAERVAKTPYDETDVGMGIPESVNDQSADEFRGELHVLRQRSLEKRRRLYG